MNKQRKTSHILNVFQYDETTGAVTLPAGLSLPTPDSTDNSTKVATTAWIRAYVGSLSYATASSVTTAIANLVASAPTTLDTLNELATALGNDPNFATTITTSIGTKVPQSRTITINGIAYDLSADRAWTIASGVTSFNTRTGAITLTSGDVTGALGFTPYNATNPSGYITGITSANVTTALGYTPYNSTNPSGYITSSGTAAAISQTLSAPNEANLVYAAIADNDFFRIRVGGSSNAGWVEIATADDGTEPIYVRQYTGVFSSLTRTATLLDGSGNTSFPGTVTAPTFSGSLSGNASSASSVAWTNVSGRPTTVSSFTNDSGYITSSYVSWGNISSRPSWMTSSSLVATHSNANDWQNSGFYENGGGGSNWPSQTWYNSINVRHSNQGNYHGFQVAMSYYDNLLWFRSYQGSGSFQSWAYAISSANIGSQSVNYATTSGTANSVAWGNVSGRPTTVSSFTNDAGYQGNGGQVNNLSTNYAGGVQSNPQVYFNNGIGLKVAMTGYWSVWSDTMWINGYAGGDVPWMCALHFLRNSEPRFAISAQTQGSGSYGSVYEVMTDYNIGSRKADGAKKLWAASHPNDYYIVNNWTGSYWQLTTNHGSAVQVGYSDNSGTASNLSGFDKSNPTFGAVYATNWFRAYGDCGLYSQDYGGHFRRNTYSYGNWEIFGYAKNGYTGIVTINNYVTAQMHNSSGDFGFLTENGAWWNLFYNNGNNCWGIGTDNTYSGDGFRCIKYGSAQYGWTTWSDRRAKENISSITGALDTVLAMRGVYFNYIQDEAKNKRVGFIAQELEQVLPEAVRYAEEIDEYSVEYAQIVSVLAEAIKEQNVKITRLEALVEQLTNN